MRKFLLSIMVILVFPGGSELAGAGCQECGLNGLSGDGGHNCRLWAAIAYNIPRTIITQQLLEEPNSLKNLAQSKNIDGWGVTCYPQFGDSAYLARGRIRAYNDTLFDSTVTQMSRIRPSIALAHVRNCSVGCCAHGADSIPDPHPFLRYKNEKYWIFAHNGTIDKELLYELVGEDYLQQNPLTGSGIPECDPDDTSKVIDSELYFLYLLKHIEENNWNVTYGIAEALVEMMEISFDEAMNFVLSDGRSVWAYRKARTLYKFTHPRNNYSIVASMYPGEEQGDWEEVNEYNLLLLRPNQPIAKVNMSNYMPAIAGVITDEYSNPVAGASVYIPNTIFDTVTDSLGNYTLNCLTIGTHDVSVAHPYYSDTTVVGVETFHDSTTTLDVTMLPPGALEGIVTNPNNRTIWNVIVTLPKINKSTWTDFNGHYRLDSLDMGEYEVLFTHRFYSDTLVGGITIYPDSTTELDITMMYPGAIIGTVLDTSRNPVSDVFVYIDQTPFYDITNRNGRFVIDSIDAGFYDLTFSHPHFIDTTIAEVEVTYGDTTGLEMVLTDQPTPVFISMFPVGSPITVPAGSSFTYTGRLQSTSYDPIQVDVWIDVALPDSNIRGQIELFENVELDPFEIATYSDIVQEVPRWAPEGIYNYISYAGFYPDSIADSSWFEFTVVRPPIYAANAWNVYGWFDVDETAGLPDKLQLHPCYPNPFNPVTTFKYYLPADSHVKLKVYNLLGQEVAVLVDDYQSKGFKTLSWNASGYASGIYFYRLTVDDHSLTRRMTLLK
jgi:predicted glutamine amidotransferase